MEPASYTNIFATKGIEYIIVIVFLILITPFWLYINKPAQLKKVLKSSFIGLTEAVLNFPKGVLFGKNHTWIEMNKTGLAAIGIDPMLQQITGNARINMLRKPGESVVKGDLIYNLEFKNNTFNIQSPISGKIVNLNSELTHINQIKENPLPNGWLFNIQPEHWKGESKELFGGNRARRWLKSETERLKDFLAISFAANSPLEPMVILQDGGEIKNYTIEELSPAICNDFQKEFLTL